MRTLLFILFTLLASWGFSQEKTVLRARVIDGDTIPEITLSLFQVNSKRTWKSKKKYREYKRLEKKVVKVYPLAHLASVKLQGYAMELSQVESEREKKKFYKRIEKEIKAEYEGELRQLTVSEGRILIKLLDRETGNTSYALVTELRGQFSAYFWQGLARVFGHNLKSRYNPKGEDKDIEFIVNRIESGLLTLKK